MENQTRTISQSFRRIGITIVLVHLLISIVHSSAHLSLHIEMNIWQNVYIFLVILLLPLVSAAMLQMRSRAGFWLLLGSMLGSLLFGGYYHFIAAGPDNVASLEPHAWAPVFQITSVLLAITEATGVYVGALGLRKKS